MHDLHANPHVNPNTAALLATRRAFLARHAGGLGAIALASLLAESRCATADESSPKTGLSSSNSSSGSNAARPPVVVPQATAKRVVCLFQHGGPSQMDLFDPKPLLQKHHGQPYPGGPWKSILINKRETCSGAHFSFAVTASAAWKCPSCSLGLARSPTKSRSCGR
jgi:hypothetical protein